MSMIFQTLPWPARRSRSTRWTRASSAWATPGCPIRARFSMRRVRWRSTPAFPCRTCCRRTPSRAALTTKATRAAAAGDHNRVRKNFLACAFWNATLVTGPQGSVTARFLAPDSLTRYRIMAVAHLDGRFGAGQSAFEVSKPLLIEPALPQFAHVGDQLLARAVIHNQSHHSGGVIVQLELDDKARANATNQQIQIAAGGIGSGRIPCHLCRRRAGEVDLAGLVCRCPAGIHRRHRMLARGRLRFAVVASIALGKPWRACPPTCLPGPTRSSWPEPAP